MQDRNTGRERVVSRQTKATLFLFLWKRSVIYIITWFKHPVNIPISWVVIDDLTVIGSNFFILND